MSKKSVSLVHRVLGELLTNEKMKKKNEKKKTGSIGSVLSTGQHKFDAQTRARF